MSFEQQMGQNSVNENNFETIYQRRIMELEQKVNKYCAQYDALMNLLPIGNHFKSVLNFQKEFTQISSRMDMIDDKVSSLNDKEVLIDKEFWEKQYRDLQKLLQKNEKQLNQIIFIQKQEQQQDDSVNFEEQLNEKLKIHSETISNKLAHHKNSIESKRHKQSHKNEDEVSRSIDKKINHFYDPIHRELNEIEEEIEIARMKIPLREINKFHDFNYQRILNDILELNETVEQIFTICNGNEIIYSKQILRRIKQFKGEIESIHYQIEGSRRNCLNDLMTHKFLHHNLISSEQMENNITKDFQQLQISLSQVRSKFQAINQYLLSH